MITNMKKDNLGTLEFFFFNLLVSFQACHI